MNGLVEDWMLKKPKAIERPNVSARLSLMQRKLLGVKGIQELEEEAYRKKQETSSESSDHSEV
jgi:hypothetical protein